MSRQYDAELRTYLLQQYLAWIGPSPILDIRTSTVPANVTAANNGTQLVQMTLPSTWMTVSAGEANLAGTWSGVASATGTPGHYRLRRAGSPSDCAEQGIVTGCIKFTTSALTAANSNVINLASTTGITVGMDVGGVGVPDGAAVIEVLSTSIKMSAASTLGVANGASVFFGDTSGDLWVPSLTITNGATVTVTARKLIYPGA